LFVGKKGDFIEKNGIGSLGQVSNDLWGRKGRQGKMPGGMKKQGLS
jgi:hypothetical protein